MKIIKAPRAIMLAETATCADGMMDYLTEVGAHVFDESNGAEPDLWETDADTGSEELVEVAGRACYKSFRPGLNPNVKKVREGNEPYLANVIAQGHGSVLEHASVTFAFVGVSRVFTHELVRHRPGAAYSQESLRYVRLEELCAWYPESFGTQVIGELHDALAKKGVLQADGRHKDEWVADRVKWLRQRFEMTFSVLEQTQRSISAMLYLDELDGDFHVKKRITSAMRRLAPIGLGTAILCTANHRAWRHMIQMRTHLGAEEEIRLVFKSVAEQLGDRFPNIYQDMMFEHDGQFWFKSAKI